MPDPKLIRSSVIVRYAADDNYHSSTEFEGKKDANPEANLLSGLDEIARILALFGFEKEAREALDDALLRVAEWRKSRTPAKEEKL